MAAAKAILITELSSNKPADKLDSEPEELSPERDLPSEPSVRPEEFPTSDKLVLRRRTLRSHPRRNMRRLRRLILSGPQATTFRSSLKTSTAINALMTPQSGTMFGSRLGSFRNNSLSSLALQQSLEDVRQLVWDDRRLTSRTESENRTIKEKLAEYDAVARLK